MSFAECHNAKRLITLEGKKPSWSLWDFIISLSVKIATVIAFHCGENCLCSEKTLGCAGSYLCSSCQYL